MAGRMRSPSAPRPMHAARRGPPLPVLQLLQLASEPRASRARRRSPPRTLASSAGRPARGMRHGAAASAAAVCLACPDLSSPISARATTRAARARRRAPHLHTQRHSHRAGAVQVGLEVALGTLRNEAHLRAWPRRGARERLMQGSRLRAGMRAPAHTAPLGCGLRVPARCSCGLRAWQRALAPAPRLESLVGLVPQPRQPAMRGAVRHVADAKGLVGQRVSEPGAMLQPSGLCICVGQQALHAHAMGEHACTCMHARMYACSAPRMRARRCCRCRTSSTTPLTPRSIRSLHVHGVPWGQGGRGGGAGGVPGDDSRWSSSPQRRAGCARRIRGTARPRNARAAARRPALGPCLQTQRGAAASGSINAQQRLCTTTMCAVPQLRACTHP